MRGQMGTYLRNKPKRVLSLLPLDSCFGPEVCSASMRALNDKQLDCQGICNIVTWKSSWKSGENQCCNTVDGRNPAPPGM